MDSSIKIQLIKKHIAMKLIRAIFANCKLLKTVKLLLIIYSSTQSAGTKVFGLLPLICMWLHIPQWYANETVTLTILFMLACVSQFDTGNCGAVKYSFIWHVKGPHCNPPLTLPLSNERNPTLLTANCLCSRTARVHSQPYDNTDHTFLCLQR